jgi:hypothetical protein
VIWTLLGAVVAAMAARALWMVGHSAIEARRWFLAERPAPGVLIAKLFSIHLGD